MFLFPLVKFFGYGIAVTAIISMPIIKHRNDLFYLLDEYVIPKNFYKYFLFTKESNFAYDTKQIKTDASSNFTDFSSFATTLTTKVEKQQKTDNNRYTSHLKDGEIFSDGVQNYKCAIESINNSKSRYKAFTNDCTMFSIKSDVKFVKDILNNLEPLSGKFNEIKDNHLYAIKINTKALSEIYSFDDKLIHKVDIVDLSTTKNIKPTNKIMSLDLKYKFYNSTHIQGYTNMMVGQFKTPDTGGGAGGKGTSGASSSLTTLPVFNCCESDPKTLNELCVIYNVNQPTTKITDKKISELEKSNIDWNTLKKEEDISKQLKDQYLFSLITFFDNKKVKIDYTYNTPNKLVTRTTKQDSAKTKLEADNSGTKLTFDKLLPAIGSHPLNINATNKSDIQLFIVS